MILGGVWLFESGYLLAVLADDRPFHVLAYILSNCTGTDALLGYSNCYKSIHVLCML